MNKFQVIASAAKELMKPCKKVCPGGEPCCCNGAIRHRLHICPDERCFCHSRERYENARDVRPQVALVPVG